MLVNDQKIHLDQISEVYSFGAVAFYMYTEVVPVAYGKSMEDPSFDFPFEKMLQAVAQCRVRSFKQAGVEPFPKLERILMRCLENDRTQRYQTFKSLLATLSCYEHMFVIVFDNTSNI